MRIFVQIFEPTDAAAGFVTPCTFGSDFALLVQRRLLVQGLQGPLNLKSALHQNYKQPQDVAVCSESNHHP